MKLLPSRSCQAFTLVEILAAVAIIAVLAALILPTIRSAQTSALRAKNMSNLRQIGIGVLGFIGDQNGHYPGNATTEEESNTRYAHLIFPYMGGKGKMITVTNPGDGSTISLLADTDAYKSPVFHSPATPPATYLKKGGDATWGVYGANSKVLTSTELVSSVRSASLQQPSRTIIIAEKNALAGSAILSVTGPYPKVAAGPAANLRNDRKPAADPNGAGPCGFLFADGHAESIDLATLRAPKWPGTLTFEPQPQ